jgi:Domain of Unknown Function (DUF1259)
MSVAEQGMIKFTFGYPAKVHSVDLDNTMGVNTWAAFAGSDENVVFDGDFAVTENEVRAALKSLREAAIAGIHSHMTGEEPRIIFFNYWDRGPAQGLAKVFRKLGLLEPRYRQNLARMSDESVGFCYKPSATV